MFGFRVSGFGFRVSGFRFQVLGFRIRVSGFVYRASGFGSRFPVLGFQGHSDHAKRLEFGCTLTRSSARGPELILAVVAVSRPVEPRILALFLVLGCQVCPEIKKRLFPVHGREKSLAFVNPTSWRAPRPGEDSAFMIFCVISKRSFLVHSPPW